MAAGISSETLSQIAESISSEKFVKTKGVVPETVKGLYEKKTEDYSLSQARADIALLELLDINPDITKDELLNDLNSTNPGWINGQENQGFLSERVDLLLNRRDTVRTATEKYASAEEAFVGFFGKNPKGEVQVARGALGVYVVCFNEEDFNYVFEAPYSKNPRGAVEGSWGGLLVKDCKDPDLNFSVVCSKSNDLLKKVDPNSTISTEDVLKHEGQHVKNWLIGDAAELEKAISLPEPDTYFETIENLPEEEFAEKFRDYIITFKEYMLEYGTKDEIGAFLEQGLSLEEIKKRLETVDYNYPEMMRIHLNNKLGQKLNEDTGFFFRGILRNTLNDFREDISTLFQKVEALKNSGISNKELAMILANTHAKQII